MNNHTSIRSFWQSFPQLPFLLAGGFSAILYLSGFGSLLFLVPYAWLLSIYSARSALLSVAVSDIALIITRFIQSVALPVVMVELLFFDSLILTLFALFVPIHRYLQSMRRLYRMLIFVAVFMVVTLPFVHSRIQDPELLMMLTDIFREVLRGQGDGAAVLPAFGEQQLPQLLTSTLRIVCGVYVAFYMMIPLVSWWMVQVMRLLSPRLFRNAPADRKPYALEQFRLPHNIIWVFIALIAVLLLFFAFQSQSMLFYACANAAVIVVLLYIMQGLALIMRVSMRRHPRVRVVRGLLFISLITLLIPFVNSILVIGVCVLGVSQTWVNYDQILDRKSTSE